MKERITIIGPDGEKEYWSETPIEEIVEEQNKEPNRYESCTKEELMNLLLSAQRLEDEGLSLTRTIIKIEEALEEKVDSGIIYDAKTPSPEKVRHDE